MPKPIREGWYWFLPDEKCPTPTGLLRTDKPVVVLVGSDKPFHSGKRTLVVRFPVAVMTVEELTGEWEEIRPPESMQLEAMKRISASLKQKGGE